MSSEEEAIQNKKKQITLTRRKTFTNAQFANKGLKNDKLLADTYQKDIQITIHQATY